LSAETQFHSPALAGIVSLIASGVCPAAPAYVSELNINRRTIMKVFAILTACMMAAGGATYYYSSSSDGGCPFSRCPVAKTGGCCTAETSAAKPDCCLLPCPACSNDCAECCAVCEDCCIAGASATKSIPTAAKAKPANCCAAGGADCCAPGADCCELAVACCVSGACCDGAKANAIKIKGETKYTLAKPAAGCASCCEVKDASPVAIATAAIVAGAGAK